jgi:hypothetical protein
MPGARVCVIKAHQMDVCSASHRTAWQTIFHLYFVSLPNTRVLTVNYFSGSFAQAAKIASRVMHAERSSSTGIHLTRSPTRTGFSLPTVRSSQVPNT